MNKIILILLLMFSPSALALTEQEEDRILQCSLKGIEFALIWEAEQLGFREVAISDMVMQLRDDGAPPRIIEIWSAQARHAAVDYEDRRDLVLDILKECIELGY